MKKGSGPTSKMKCLIRIRKTFKSDFYTPSTFATLKLTAADNKFNK